MFDNIVCIITIVLALAILILGVIFLIQEDHLKLIFLD